MPQELEGDDLLNCTYPSWERPAHVCRWQVGGMWSLYRSGPKASVDPRARLPLEKVKGKISPYSAVLAGVTDWQSVRIR